MDGASTLGVLRAAYRTDVDEAEWVAGIAASIGAALDEGLGVQTMLCDLRGEVPEIRHARLDGGTAAWAEVWRANWLGPHIEALSRAQLAQVLAFAPVSRASDLWAALSHAEPTYGVLLRRLAREGWNDALGPVVGEASTNADDRLFYPDSLNVVAFDPCGLAVAVVANRAERARPGASAREAERLGAVAAHLTAALRLRTRHGSARAALNAAEVVFDRRGRVVHAVGDGIAARETLTRAARRGAFEEGASSREILARRRALLEGRWSLVDLDVDGEAWLAACPNAPRAAKLEQLTQRERQVVALVALGRSNKAIAYELGVTSSTVATLVARVRWKLGASSATELVRIARAATLDLSRRGSEREVELEHEPGAFAPRRRRSDERLRADRAREVEGRDVGG